VQQPPVARQQVERARGAARVVPVGHERVEPVLDELLVAGHGGRDAGGAHVEALERRPVHALDARQLEHDVGVGVLARQLLLRERPDHAVGANRGLAVPARRRDERRDVRLVQLA
jgi:hypothetical protein